MVAVVFVLATLNLALGFGLAVALAQAPSFSLGSLSSLLKRRTAHVEVKSAGQNAPAGDSPPTPAPNLPPALASEAPAEWTARLHAVSLTVESFVEAAIQSLRLGLRSYRTALLDIDDQLRALPSPTDCGRLLAVSDQLRTLNATWLEEQRATARELDERRGRFGSQSDIGNQLATFSADQAAQIERILTNMQSLDLVADAEHGRVQIARQTCLLVDFVHSLRDRLDDALVAVLDEKRIGTLPRDLTFDSASALPNRIGLEALLRDWWRDDPKRQRALSCALVDVDRFFRLNERLGPRRLDALLAGLGRWLDGQVRHDRGHDEVARVGGQSFLLLLGDTPLPNAIMAAERIRQTLNFSTIAMDHEQLTLTASFAVALIGKDETSHAFMARLQQALRHAKQNGRDRTSADEGQGPQNVAPHQVAVKPRVVHIDRQVGG
jgi:diguanylate cyclase (GGDEF)-like protein